ncbi:glutamyl-tRNA synthetase [Pontibacter aydingkolensis]|uniref:tRNA glutamyl-Q synthetase n=1 Tax=Pontibacter aydingkolensis TaxID=1911536 RepID=A0ABS7CQ41_9BACT|nr:glutamate--tRNA ligase family protein [Pontibacter aydingkolensis]MBW7465930.1 tRNA glutamyl-Q synthetase [Pontibacter aydingkolensis]
MQQPPEPKAKVKTRLAPTPSGYLHLGNALSFAITWALTRKQQGILALRIDDLDNARFRPEYLQDIFDTISFMGIDYDEGPRSPADFYEDHSQHQRLSCYQDLLNKLVEKDMVYACPCSRTQIAEVSPNGLYPLTCRDEGLALDTAETAWRVRVPEDTVISFHDQLLGNCTVALHLEMPDFVVRRKDDIPAYQITSLCDDLEMGINLIVRGEDLMISTAAQLFLAEQVGATAFTNAQFIHHPIILTDSGSKLSKSDDALSITEMRSTGLTTKELWAKLAYTLGWQDANITNAESFLKRFTLEGLPRHIRQV